MVWLSILLKAGDGYEQGVLYAMGPQTGMRRIPAPSAKQSSALLRRVASTAEGDIVFDAGGPGIV
jgi:hypothetical protein